MSRTRRISRFALVGVLIAALYIVLYLAFLHFRIWTEFLIH